MRIFLVVFSGFLSTYSPFAQAPSAGCGNPNPPEGNLTVPVAEVTEPREYIVQLPNNYDPNTPYPVVFGFHGRGSGAEMFSGSFYGGLGPAVEDDAIAVFPQGIGSPVSWSDDSDLDFFDAILAELKATTCIDEGMVFAMGHSAGGFMTNNLGCQRGDVLRGIGPICGGGPFTFNSNCVGQVATWIGHGGSDSVVSITSGESSRDHWAKQNNCDLNTESADLHPDCVTYAGCDANYPVNWCVYDGGHAPDDPLWMGEGVWGFFKGLTSLTDESSVRKSPKNTGMDAYIDLIPHSTTNKENTTFLIHSPEVRSLSLITIQGVEVFGTSLSGHAGDRVYTLSGKRWQAGVYFVRVEVRDQVFTQKVVLN